jgi:inner membrane protein
MIPSGFISSLISERQLIRNEALIEVSSKWGSNQNIGGPVLYVPIEVDNYNTASKVTTKKINDYAKFLPNQLQINGTVEPEIRYRGIYKFVLYSSQINISGDFIIPDYSDLNLQNGVLKWNESTILIGITDMIGIKNTVNLNWNNKTINFSPGSKDRDFYASGLTANVKIDPSQTGKFNFNYTLNIKGSQELTFLPLGKDTTVKISSNWNNPSFQGAFLPEERNITDTNFDATWKILDMNRNFPQKWTGYIDVGAVNNSKFGVNFLIPIDTYKETNRAVKYIIIFVGLTFTIFFFVEIMNKKKIHPIQYLFIGFSLVIFYLLLISLSEQLNFAIAYVISAISIAVMISLYSLSIVKNKIFSISIGVKLCFLYGFLYVLLLNQDYSLLLGSVALFVILAIIMYFSRNIDWYNIELNESSTPKDDK